jgi:ABC-type multidrug transport system fused ATPase/permease subunit
MSRVEILFSNTSRKEANKLYDFKMKEHQNGVFSDKWGFLAYVCASGFTAVLPFLGVVLFVLYDSRGLSLETIPVLVAFVVFSAKLSGMIYAFVQFIGEGMDNFPDIKKFWDFLDDTPDMVGYTTGADFIHGTGSIKLRNVGFKYSADSDYILNKLNVSIKGGTKVALVGRSGSGKTTIAKLITGYMRPSGGEVIVDGQNLNGVALKTYYPYIGYLTQEPMVFDGSVRENLLYATGEREVPDAEIVTALEKSQCDFILKSKAGLETQIGEKGIRLSGGERQRLAIAKLLLKNPEIIVLDEPTSALDSFSEDAVTKAMNELFVGRTVVIIAHRLQTVKSADRIIVLEKGQIVEQGTHKELVQKSGTYARMLEMQSGF